MKIDLVSPFSCLISTLVVSWLLIRPTISVPSIKVKTQIMSFCEAWLSDSCNSINSLELCAVRLSETKQSIHRQSNLRASRQLFPDDKYPIEKPQ